MKKYLDNIRFFQKAAVFDAEGKVLALKRSNEDTRRPGCWDFPGGNFEKGEDVYESVAREVEEETGLSLNGFEAVYIQSLVKQVPEEVDAIAVGYVVVADRQKVKLSPEHVEYKWIGPKEFEELETGEDEGFLKAMLRKAVERYEA